MKKFILVGVCALGLMATCVFASSNAPVVAIGGGYLQVIH